VAFILLLLEKDGGDVGEVGIAEVVADDCAERWIADDDDG